MKLITFFAILFFFSCRDVKDLNHFDWDKVYLEVVNTEKKNIFGNSSGLRLSLDSVKLYYLDRRGKEILQPHTREDTKKLSIFEGDADSGNNLVVRISLETIANGRSVTIVDFFEAGRLTISANVNVVGVAGPMGGSLYYSDLVFDGGEIEKKGEGSYRVAL
ncbi:MULTISPECIES: hypothetical protein [Sphingobacterium]|uniref:hypothetical protein n=1 Tax=Sphingobacterium TaxID=28453 RepID=UPI00257E7A15|nr:MULTISPECIES: hypothetical protein [Sphingobacterium]